MTRYLFFISTLVLLLVCYRAHGGLQKPTVDVGVSGVVPNITLYGGVIVSDQKSITSSLYTHLEAHPHIEHNKTQIGDVLQTRSSNVKRLSSLLPFDLLKWPVINTRPCPNYQHTGHNRLERGQGMSHLQIWLEFVFFDNDVLDARVRKTPEYITSNDYSSVSGIFQSVENGSLYKNGIPFKDDDIMIVLEDTAVVVGNITQAEGASETADAKSVLRNHLTKVLSHIKTDLVSLGVINKQTNMESRQLSEMTNSNHELSGTHIAHTTHAHAQHTKNASHISTPRHTTTHNIPHVTTQSTITAYAYALTRAGARKLIHCYDHCGHFIQDQLTECVEAELITHAHAPYPLFEKL